MTESKGGALIVIPTLNEAAHIGRLLDQFSAIARRRPALRRDAIVVVDGGSSDPTRDIVTAHPAAAEGLVMLLYNPDRIQSAGINRAVERHGGDRKWLIRVDAHARYPDDYCDVLIAEAEATEAASVVVAMRAVGAGPAQKAIALAQNSRIGNGGASHRAGTGGRFVDHGHHALMRLEAFRAVGGYDPAFSHNEDAELDLRLAQRGYAIWQTTRTGIDYIPRSSLGALARQYARFGAGRAATLHKHWRRPKTRQVIVMALAPLVYLAVLAPVWPALAIPAAIWAIICLLAGLVLARGDSGPQLGLMAGAAAAVMHLAWSTGFWWFWLGHRPAGRPQTAEAGP